MPALPMPTVPAGGRPRASQASELQCSLMPARTGPAQVVDCRAPGGARAPGEARTPERLQVALTS
eukprot:13653175-Alexandrium_andersonii.AAC.1